MIVKLPQSQKEITVKRLSVGKIFDAEEEGGKSDRGYITALIRLATGITKLELDELDPNDYLATIKAVTEVNATASVPVPVPVPAPSEPAKEGGAK